MVNQYKVFSAILSNFESAQKSLDEQMNIHGTTMKQNAIYMESLEAKTALFRAELEKLILSGGELQSIAKTVIDVATKALKLLNTDIGKTAVGITVLVAVASLASKGFISLTASIKGLGKEELATALKTSLLAGDFSLLGASIQSVTLAMLKSPLFIGGVAILGISAIIKGVDSLNTTLKEHQEKLSEMKDSYSETHQEVETLESDLENINNSIKEINSKEKLSLTDEQELMTLRLEREELEKQLAIKKELEESQQRTYEKEAKATVNKKVYDPYAKGRVGTGSTLYSMAFGDADRVELAKNYSAQLTEMGERIEVLSERKERLGELDKEDQKELDGLVKKYGDMNTKTAEFVNALREETSMLDENSETKQRVKEAEDAYMNTLMGRGEETSKLTGLAYYLADAENEESESLQTQKELTKELVKEMENLAKQYDFSSTSIDKMKEAFETLAKVEDEINSDTGLTVETYDALMSMGSEYVNILFDEEGQLRNTAEAQKDLYKIKIQQMALEEAQNLINLVRTYKEAGEELKVMNVILGENIELEWEKVYVDTMLLGLNEEEETALKRRIKQMQNWADKASRNIDIMTDSTKKTKENSKAVKDQAKAYEEAIKYIKSKYDEEINALKDEKKNAVDQIEEQIKARKEQKEQEIQAIDDEVDALKKEKEARQDYWDAQIDALKESNEKRKDSLELQKKLDDLAKAKGKRVKVYKEGQGFVYDEDDSAVSKAQSDLSKYLSEQQYEKELENLTKLKEEELKSYDDRLNALSDFKKQKERDYDAEIDVLEKYKDSVEKNYDAQIKIYENYKKQFEDMVDAYKDNQSKLLVQQLTGIDLENKNWMTRLDNLQNFVNQYHSLLAQVDGDSGSGGGGGNFGGGGSSDKNTPSYDVRENPSLTPKKKNKCKSLCLKL